MSLREEGITPSLTEIMKELIEDRVYEMNTMMPATITKVDKARGLVTVKPSFKRVYADSDEPVELPDIPGVPVWELRAGDAVVRLPVKEGQRCMLLFSQRAMERWKATGANDRPGVARTHALADAVCIPGLVPVTEAKPIGDDLQIEFGKATVRIKDSELLEVKIVNALLAVNKEGKFKLSNGTSELLALIAEQIGYEITAVDELLKATWATSLGPSGTLVNPVPFTQLVSNMKKVKSKLEKLIMG